MNIKRQDHDKAIKTAEKILEMAKAIQWWPFEAKLWAETVLRDRDRIEDFSAALVHNKDLDIELTETQKRKTLEILKSHEAYQGFMCKIIEDSSWRASRKVVELKSSYFEELQQLQSQRNGSASIGLINKTGYDKTGLAIKHDIGSREDDDPARVLGNSVFDCFKNKVNEKPCYELEESEKNVFVFWDKGQEDLLNNPFLSLCMDLICFSAHYCGFKLRFISRTNYKNYFTPDLRNHLPLIQSMYGLIDDSRLSVATVKDYTLAVLAARFGGIVFDVSQIVMPHAFSSLWRLMNKDDAQFLCWVNSHEQVPMYGEWTKDWEVKREFTHVYAYAARKDSLVMRKYLKLTEKFRTQLAAGCPKEELGLQYFSFGKDTFDEILLPAYQDGTIQRDLRAVTLPNVPFLLEDSPELADLVSFNPHTCHPLTGGAMQPWFIGSYPELQTHEITESMYSSLKSKLSNIGFIKIQNTGGAIKILSLSELTDPLSKRPISVLFCLALHATETCSTEEGVSA